VRALDLAKMFTLRSTMEGALKFAQRMRKPALEERVGLLIQAKAAEAQLEERVGLLIQAKAAEAQLTAALCGGGAASQLASQQQVRELGCLVETSTPVRKG
jgi:site-specific recombinase